MPVSSLGDLAVRINVVGHASPQWKGASNAAEANKLNQGLSDLRAQNVRTAVEEMLKKELPWLPIAVPSKGVGSQERFPTASENNAAVDRSVLVTIELTTSQQTVKIQPHGPRRIYVPSTIWILTVKHLYRGAGLGYAQVFLRITVKNPYSGKEITLAGNLFGGQLSTSIKSSFRMSRAKPNLGTIGTSVAFETYDEMDFDKWSKGTMATLFNDEVDIGIRSKTTFLILCDVPNKTGFLIFDQTKIGLSFPKKLPKVDFFAVSGKLSMEGPRPTDMIDLASYPDIIPTGITSRHNSGLFLTFPTGKASLSDLTTAGRKDLREFVTNKARAIKDLSSAFKTSAARP